MLSNAMFGWVNLYFVPCVANDQQNDVEEVCVHMCLWMCVGCTCTYTCLSAIRLKCQANVVIVGGT